MQSFLRAMTFLGGLTFGAAAWATPPSSAAPAPAAGTSGANDGPSEADDLGARGADQGAFLPLGVAATTAAPRGVLTMGGGYDAARGGPLFDAAVQVRLVGPLSLRAGAAYVGPDGTFRPSGFAVLQALRQQRAGVDLAFYGGYEAQGFNTVPALQLTVALGRQLGRLSLLGNVSYGFGLDEGEHYGTVRLAALYRVARAFSVGLDTRGRIDLERDDDEPENEPDLELMSGPAATLSLGRFALTATAGLSLIKFRRSDDVTASAQAQLLFGTAF